MSFFKTFGAGFSSVGQSIRNNWKKILLGIALVPVFMFVIGLLVFVTANGLRLFITWLTSIKGLNEFLAAHPLAFVFGTLGFVLSYALLSSVYVTGREKLKEQNDKVSGI